METQQQVKQGNSQDDFIQFFKGLPESYQKYLINKMQKVPPDFIKKLHDGHVETWEQLKNDIGKSKDGPIK